jgi:hypothetical protein
MAVQQYSLLNVNVSCGIIQVSVLRPVLIVKVGTRLQQKGYLTLIIFSHLFVQACVYVFTSEDHQNILVESWKFYVGFYIQIGLSGGVVVHSVVQESRGRVPSRLYEHTI